ncbi:Hypothetical protein PFR_JS17-2_1964 [Propionibacterium freudenreichii]|nr:Hypothetical protein PFR_JS17-1_1965 [Propionibacterium freudenreichii]SCQ81053.1 Hypothetical protein PFR_JS17-2_1964 [Propionibacterium freudenreichii]
MKGPSRRRGNITVGGDEAKNPLGLNEGPLQKEGQCPVG